MTSSEAKASPHWGHPLTTPDGREIRVPKRAFPILRKLGLLENGRAKLHPAAYLMMHQQYDSITQGLRHLLGSDLSGPAWLVCHCRECMRHASEADDTELPGKEFRQWRAEQAISQMRLSRSATH